MDTKQLGILVFAHGARNPDWGAPMRVLAKQLSERFPSSHVSVAFLQFGEPSLPDAIDFLASQGVTKVVVLPVFLAAGGHLLTDLPQILTEAKKRHPHLEFFSADALGEAPEVISAMAVVSEAFIKSNVAD